MSFTFKQFHCDDSRCGMKISTDGVLLGAWAGIEHAGHIADIGAGSGIIALMMAQRNPSALITAIDIDPQACQDARQNVAASPWNDRIDIRCLDFDLWLPSKTFDAIVSNPPFFTETMRSPQKARAQARHCSDGLGYRLLVKKASSLLNYGGLLSVILPAEYESDLIFQAELSRLKLKRLCRVHTRQDKPPLRILAEFVKGNTSETTSRLSIYDKDGLYSDEYRQLTSDFYLNF